ncbi:MAG: Re/Si-specific NAD(P)(+) transhydrogenase subunit alpha [Candidatus Bipolaricaulia bacterium]
MKVAVPKEIVPDERRVALVPEVVARLVKSEIEIWVESGAGEGAFFPDPAYEEAGAKLASDPTALLGEADVVLKVQPPVLNNDLGVHELELMKQGAILIGLLQARGNPELMNQLAERKITGFSLELLPRITRAQEMDALSSMSTIAGYKAALIAAGSLGKFFPMMMTAAGTIIPSKVFILGAGVAGLQAIATARRLGAIVEAFDIRPVVKEQVESLGATFVTVELEEEQTEDTGGYAKEISEESQRREQELIHQHVQEADAVITTALVPGKAAPVLITEDMVNDMKPGSVIVDLAAEAGGNCELTEPGTEVIHHGVTIHGPLNLPSTMPVHASQMYAKNISGFLLHLIQENELHLDFEDEITRETCITHAGEIPQAPAQM